MIDTLSVSEMAEARILDQSGYVLNAKSCQLTAALLTRQLVGLIYLGLFSSSSSPLPGSLHHGKFMGLKRGIYIISPQFGDPGQVTLGHVNLQLNGISTTFSNKKGSGHNSEL